MRSRLGLRHIAYMGKFTYEGNVTADFDDRLLAHLQAVIMAKVRRGESFPFTWKDDMSLGGGRTTVYIHPHASMIFKFHGGRSPQLNPAWLHVLTYNANSGRGLYVSPEPGPGAAQHGQHVDPMVFSEVRADDPEHRSH